MSMFHVRFHGRGGQGVVTAAELLSVAAFLDGRHAQALPSFGSERTGAPVVAFCRISDRPIRTREPIDRPEAVVVLDATLLHAVDPFAGMSDDGYVLINSARPFSELGLAALVRDLRPDRLLTVPATALAMQHIGRPLPNTVMLGGLAAMSDVVSAESVMAAIRERFTDPAVAAANVAAVTAARHHVAVEREALAHA